MLRQRATLLARLLYVADLGLIAAAFGLAYWSRNAFLASWYGALMPVEDYVWLLLGALPIWSVLLRYFGLYESFRTRPVWAEPWALLEAAFWASFCLAALTFVLKYHNVSRLFVGMFGAWAWLLLTVARTILRAGVRRARSRGLNTRNVLVVGTGRRAREIAALIEQQRHWGLRLIGLVSDVARVERRAVGGYPVVGTVEEIDRILGGQVVDEVILAVSRKRLDELEPVVLKCEELGIRAHIALNFFPRMISKLQLQDLHGVPLLTFSTTPADEFALALKRTFDIVASATALLALWPALVAIAVAVKVSSPGPVLFRQKRVGLNGRLFTLYKFRSMVADAEARKAALLHLNEMRGPAFKIANDPRVTPVGAFLRRTSLDELPQLFNVLRGDMSVVGPRPPVPDEVVQYEPWQRRRLSMKPGLTCLWQVNGRNGIADFDRWMELDLQYIDSWSLKLDMKIFLKTIPVVLLGRGAA